MERKKIVIDQANCIGCGACSATYPEDIVLNADGLAETVSGEADAEAIDICPVGAISEE
jgi:ferredoxin